MKMQDGWEEGLAWGIMLIGKAVSNKVECNAMVWEYLTIVSFFGSCPLLYLHQASAQEYR